MSISIRALGVSSLVALAALFAAPFGADAATQTVSMGPNYFTPANITVYVGDSIIWRNTDGMAHTVTARGGTFDSGTIQAGGDYSLTFNTPGSYTYDCIFHPGMTGTITVLARSQSTPTPTPTYTPTQYNYTPQYQYPQYQYQNTYAPATGQPYTYSNVPPSTSNELRSQAEALLARVQQLQAQLATQGGASAVPTYAAPGANFDSSSCPLIGRTLYIGDTGEDVTRLQQFLARDPAMYPEAIASGYYGPLTEAAVKRWQTKYNIVSTGSAGTTGYGQVGPRTAAAIALLCTTGSYGGIPGPTGGSPSVGGFIQVTPVSGNPPLDVAIQATVNTVNSCNGGTYQLDFGDGSLPAYISVPTGQCTQLTQTLGHTYQRSGSYLITLSAGGHRTSATVQVLGSSSSPSPSPSPTPSVSTSWGIVSVTPAVNGDPYRVSIEIEYPACAAYSIDWDDNSTPSAKSASSSCNASNAARATATHTYSTGGSYTVALRDQNGTVKATSAVIISN